ncbi:hypothetical protein [Almyronema epifaneia]|uniref:Uncharacterized protein n=1 Tax=Almyronema epifaneia S1 TaxID=2991925 RepID=A0ABW6ID41_9CYAN
MKEKKGKRLSCKTLAIAALSLFGLPSAQASSPSQAISPQLYADINIFLPGRVELEPVREVVVEFVALGDDWASIYLNGQRVIRQGNFNRREQIVLAEGAYYLQIAGITRFDSWASGYLDVGRSRSNVLVIVFSKEGGIQSISDPLAWIPDFPNR